MSVIFDHITDHLPVRKFKPFTRALGLTETDVEQLQTRFLQL